MYRVLEDNPGEGRGKVNLFDLATRIHAEYGFPSQKLTKMHNRLADDCLVYAGKEGLSEVVSVLGMLERFNRNKALALFKK